jgi:hypothetical protein
MGITGHFSSYLCTAIPYIHLLPQEVLNWASSGKASAQLEVSLVKAHRQSHTKDPKGKRKHILT